MLTVMGLFCVALIMAFLIVQLRRRFFSGDYAEKKEPYIKPDSAKVNYLEKDSFTIPVGDQVDVLMDESDPIEKEKLIISDDNPPLEASPSPSSEDFPPVKTFSDEEALVVLHLRASENRPYCGYELLQAILSVGFRYGKMSIFHRYEKKTNKGAVLFSLASATAPGTFDLPNMGGFSTSGLTVFLDLNKVPDPMNAFEMMLHAAGQLTDDLGGRVLNCTGDILTKEMVREVCLKIRRVESSKVNLDLFDVAEIES